MHTYHYPPTENQLVTLAGKMRHADRKEVWLSDHHTALQAIRNAHHKSIECFAVETGNEELLCIYGVARSSLEGVFVPWMLGTTLLETGKWNRELLKDGKRVVANWYEKYPLMGNFVHYDNKISMRWLEWLGFEIWEPREHGPESAPFCPFFMKGRQKEYSDVQSSSFSSR